MTASLSLVVALSRPRQWEGYPTFKKSNLLRIVNGTSTSQLLLRDGRRPQLFLSITSTSSRCGAALLDPCWTSSATWKLLAQQVAALLFLQNI